MYFELNDVTKAMHSLRNDPRADQEGGIHERSTQLCAQSTRRFMKATPTISDAIEFVAEPVKAVPLHRTVIIDFGFIAGRGWAVIEFNAARGAGLNGCKVEKVLPAVDRAICPAYLSKGYALKGDSAEAKLWMEKAKAIDADHVLVKRLGKEQPFAASPA